MRAPMFLFLLSIAATPAVAKELFVDVLVGSDQFDGVARIPSDSGSGPVRTLHRAMGLAGFGDSIYVIRPGSVFHESLSMSGSRYSGTPLQPFTLFGNGAIISGLRAVPPQGWRPAGTDLWKLTLSRKGFNRLLRDGKPLPEILPAADANPLDALKAGEWVAWRGSLYFRADTDAPSTQNFSFAADQTGLSLYRVEHVRIVDVTFRDFRFDGVNAQNMAEGIQLENVQCIENGRAGIAISGTSNVRVTGGHVGENGRFQIRAAYPGRVELHDVKMDGEPTVVRDTVVRE